MAEGDGNNLLVRGGTVVTMNQKREVFIGDIVIRQGKIAALTCEGRRIGRGRSRDARVLDARGCHVFPGFIQPHVHLCQTLFRGLAEDRSLLPWLKERIWPLEAAHDESSLRFSALLGCLELLKGGTTAILGMETVHHTDSVIQAVARSGLRATIGKAMMDRGRGIPSGLRESTARSLRESLRLIETYHGTEGGRIRCAFAPRFILSCSEGLLRQVGQLSRDLGIRVQTHASEEPSSALQVKREKGTTEIAFLDRMGLLGENTSLVHCVHLSKRDTQILKRTDTRVVHCPGSNLKLGSGIAPVPKLLRLGISVSLAADGAACNNNLDALVEMRQAALIQRIPPRIEFLPAQKIVEMATIEGARALGLESMIGSLEPGKEADLVVLDLSGPHVAPDSDIYSSLIYAARPSDVKVTVVAGRPVVRAGVHLWLDEQRIVEESRRQLRRLLRRARIG